MPRCYTDHQPNYNPAHLLSSLVVGAHFGWYVEEASNGPAHTPLVKDEFGLLDKKFYFKVPKLLPYRGLLARRSGLLLFTHYCLFLPYGPFLLKSDFWCVFFVKFSSKVGRIQKRATLATAGHAARVYRSPVCSLQARIAGNCCVLARSACQCGAKYYLVQGQERLQAVDPALCLDQHDLRCRKGLCECIWYSSRRSRPDSAVRPAQPNRYCRSDTLSCVSKLNYM
jgi:hypothetical protein